MATRKGLAQANTLRSNNTTETGYGVVYADEISGHRTVANLTALYALNDWQLSISKNNTDNDAIGQLWYVVDADGKGNGDLYQLKNWENRKKAEGWQKFSAGTVDMSSYQTTAEADKKYVKEAELTALADTDIDNLWSEAITK